MIEKEQVLWQVAQQMTLNLQANNKKLAEVPGDYLAKASEKAGIFAVFYSGRELGLGLGKSTEPSMLYVDATKDIPRHLWGEDTGATGLRRSLAALLAFKYDLQARPRSNDPEDVDRFDNYALTPESEAKLTEWMHENLYIGVVAATPDTINQLIPAMISANAPVLNLTNNINNQYGAEVKRCRKQMAAAARAYQE
ncbi:MAG TPA: hypothetical protein IAB00_06930 [Candidatus Avidehalobacter gallistercoris]|uniref:GIY-YIG catalytic domain-containing protein n=1 Tax=Candidatus Avidehalobacter gallistercoris TaxID=2840694 RepID=A0A9D1KYB8_9FIRM|nr:hypothetical protein [Candidatus Avidehalobacter gallistercoris]